MISNSKAISTKRHKLGSDYTNASQEQSTSLKIGDLKHNSAQNIRDGNSHNLTNILKSNDKKPVKSSKSLGAQKPKFGGKDFARKESDQVEVNKFDVDVSMPGKKAQCVRNVRSIFSRVIDRVNLSN